MQIFEIAPIIIVAIVCFGAYGAFLLIVLYGLGKKVQSPDRHGEEEENMVTVVVAARNEANNIGFLLQDLRNQDYKNFEVIVVNDHSDDSTRAIVEKFSDIILIDNTGVGKKSAIATGIHVAKGEIIATTDADCRVGKNWLASINRRFQVEDIDMVIGAVALSDSNTFFGRMQQLEFAALVATSASTLRLGLPTMCNGANFAYRKNMFMKVGGYSGNQQIASGDDEFLMRKFFDENPTGIVYMKSPVVKTSAQKSLWEFIQQRLRWAGKWRFNSSGTTKLLAVFIFATQAVSMYGFYRILAGDRSFVLLMSLKLVADLMTLVRCTKFLGIPFYTLAFLLLELCYPFYVTFIGFLSFFKSYTWKGRKYATL